MTRAAEPRALAAGILGTPDPAGKVRLSLELARAWKAGRLKRDFSLVVVPPDRPARPLRPKLLMPRDMPCRKASGAPEKCAAMLHALAHIELNAIDLAHDMLARFDHAGLPSSFAHDWISVAAEEASHFAMLCGRLGELGFGYGDFPAHDGLWQAAIETRHDVLARIAIVPLVLEARGLDVTPSTIEAFAGRGDWRSAEILAAILRDEISHVATGMRWFDRFARSRGLAPEDAWRDLVARHFKGRLKPPFNREAREAAGMPASFYLAAAG